MSAMSTCVKLPDIFLPGLRRLAAQNEIITTIRLHTKTMTTLLRQGRHADEKESRNESGAKGTRRIKLGSGGGLLQSLQEQRTILIKIPLQPRTLLQQTRFLDHNRRLLGRNGTAN